LNAEVGIAYASMFPKPPMHTTFAASQKALHTSELRMTRSVMIHPAHFGGTSYCCVSSGDVVPPHFDRQPASHRVGVRDLNCDHIDEGCRCLPGMKRRARVPVAATLMKRPCVELDSGSRV
jgi:hypothetical protein